MSWGGKCWCGKTGFRKPWCYNHWVSQIPQDRFCNCGKIAVYKNLECESCRQKRYSARVRSETIEAYGGKCKCCGENSQEFLTIDHINGDGARHRNEIYGAQRSHAGVTFYKWLKKQGFPTDNYRLLCYNCNCSLGFFGYCPHGRL